MSQLFLHANPLTSMQLFKYGFVSIVNGCTIMLYVIVYILDIKKLHYLLYIYIFNSILQVTAQPIMHTSLYAI